MIGAAVNNLKQKHLRILGYLHAVSSWLSVVVMHVHTAQDILVKLEKQVANALDVIVGQVTQPG